MCMTYKLNSEERVKYERLDLVCKKTPYLVMPRRYILYDIDFSVIWICNELVSHNLQGRRSQ